MPKSANSVPVDGPSRREKLNAVSSLLPSPTMVDVYLYHEGKVRHWSDIPMTLLSTNVSFPTKTGVGWFHVETCVAGILGNKNAIHCLLSGNTTLADVLETFAEHPCIMWDERL